jgi:hypothetical protein
VRIRSAKGIDKWPGSVAASWQRVGGGAHLGGDEETAKRGRYFQALPPLIGGGEREGQGGPLGSATDAGVEPESATGSARQVPWLRVADRRRTVVTLTQ